MNSGYVILNDEFSSMLINSVIGPENFNYKDAYDYLKAIYNTGKLIIANMIISSEFGGEKVENSVQPAFDISKSLKNGVTSYVLMFCYQKQYYTAKVDSSNKNQVVVTAI